MSYKCPRCDKVVKRIPKNCSYCGTRYTPGSWDEISVPLKTLEQITRTLSRTSKLPFEVTTEFILHRCPDGCGSGHVKGQCIHMVECLNRYASKQGWLL